MGIDNSSNFIAEVIEYFHCTFVALAILKLMLVAALTGFGETLFIVIQ
jgi:hypothetical protein